MITDRQYWHHFGAKAWHSYDPRQTVVRMTGPGMGTFLGLCGRHVQITGEGDGVDHADRIPPDAHLCGSCARIIAARTDIES